MTYLRHPKAPSKHRASTEQAPSEHRASTKRAPSKHQASTKRTQSKYVLGQYAQRKKNIHPKLEFDKTEPTEPLVWPPKLNLEPTEPQRLYEPPNRTRFHPSLV